MPTHSKFAHKKSKSLLALLGFILTATLLATLLTTGAVSATNPNLDGDTQPNRTRLADCLKDIRDVTAWSETETQQAAIDLCQVRVEHQQAKTKFMAGLAQLSQEYKDVTNHGLNEHLPKAIQEAWTIVDLCIQFKDGFTYPHNIAIYSLPEAIHRDCYKLGSQLVDPQVGSTSLRPGASALGSNLDRLKPG